MQAGNSELAADLEDAKAELAAAQAGIKHGKLLQENAGKLQAANATLTKNLK